ncbi:hypothetical protein N309_03760, partial [Tinamus guttatus]
RGGGRAVSSLATMDFRRANFSLFRDLLGRIPWASALEGRGAQESWLVFKRHFLHAQQQCIPVCKKSGRGGRRPAWMSKELVAMLKQKAAVYRMWKKGQAPWEKYRNVVRECRDATRKAKARLEHNLARDVKNNKKKFFKYINSKKKSKENVGPLADGMGTLVTNNIEKAELLNAFFASVFTKG